MPYQFPELLAMALATGLSSGLNVYASVALLGLLQRFGMVALPALLDTLAHPWVIAAALALYLVEFVADKIPGFSSARHEGVLKAGGERQSRAVQQLGAQPVGGCRRRLSYVVRGTPSVC